ncbi:Rieske (2Fe-2S) protein [Halomonas sp. AOP13-D3-9]
MKWIHLCALDDIAPGESPGFDPLNTGRDTVFVLRLDDDLVVAYQNACPHVSGARMGWKKDKFLSSSGEYITCFAHNALFRKEDGECVAGPCLGQRLSSVEVDVRGQQVYILDA